MTGVVLCGGHSTRMGRDKGLIEDHGKTWAVQAAEKFEKINCRSVISVNQYQMAAYAKIFNAGQLIADKENIRLKGPLLGLMSVHHVLNQEDLLVLACDLPQMDPVLLKLLLDAVAKTEFEAYAYETDDGIQPLCAVYTLGALQKISQLLRKEQLRRCSMKYVLECLNVKYIAAPKDCFHFFSNFNRPEDVTQAGSVC